VGEAAEDGDELAQEIVQRAAFYLAVAVGASVITLNPEVVIIGGGGAQLGPRLLDPIQEMLRERVYHHSIREVPVVGAKLGTDSGMIGAGALAFLEKPQVVSQSRSIATRRGERNKRAV
jgi:glucokinase